MVSNMPPAYGRLLRMMMGAQKAAEPAEGTELPDGPADGTAPMPVGERPPEDLAWLKEAVEAAAKNEGDEWTTLEALALRISDALALRAWGTAHAHLGEVLDIVRIFPEVPRNIQKLPIWRTLWQCLQGEGSDPASADAEATRPGTAQAADAPKNEPMSAADEAPPATTEDVTTRTLVILQECTINNPAVQRYLNRHRAAWLPALARLATHENVALVVQACRVLAAWLEHNDDLWGELPDAVAAGGTNDGAPEVPQKRARPSMAPPAGALAVATPLKSTPVTAANYRPDLRKKLETHEKALKKQLKQQKDDAVIKKCVARYALVLELWPNM